MGTAVTDCGAPPNTCRPTLHTLPTDTVRVAGDAMARSQHPKAQVPGPRRPRVLARNLESFIAVVREIELLRKSRRCRREHRIQTNSDACSIECRSRAVSVRTSAPRRRSRSPARSNALSSRPTASRRMLMRAASSDCKGGGEMMARLGSPGSGRDNLSNSAYILYRPSRVVNSFTRLAKVRICPARRTSS